jgi:threonine dehydrogenase-like Zn-dependent dehydrogenase
MGEKMRVVAITEERKVEVKEVRMPQPKENQILMRIKACAICTWEQRTFTRESRMPLPFVGGHEIAGEVAQLGKGVNPAEFPVGGKIVARLINVCGKCYFCRRGEENLCVELNNLDSSEMEIMGTGGMGEYLAINASQAYRIPDELPDVKAAFAEPLACVLNSIEKGKIELGDDVVVIGGGIMGMLHVMSAKLSGARVILSEPDPERRRIAEELGCDITFNPLEKNPVEYVRSLTEGRGAEAVFNTTPISAVAKQAVEMTAPMGRCIMYSSQHPDKPFEISPNWLHNSETIVTGAVSPSVRSFNRSVNLLAKKIIDPENLVSGTYSYGNAQDAFEAAVRPDTFRIIVTF